MAGMTSPDQPKPLLPRHERFVAEYLKDLNATQAYIRAGYRPRGAQASASKLLKQPQIEAAIAEGQRRLAQTLRITVERMAAEYATIAFANVDDFITVEGDGRVRVDLAKAGRAQRAGLLELTVTEEREDRPQRVKLKLGKLQALEGLARRMEMFVEKPPPVIDAAQHEELLYRIDKQRRLADSERERRLDAEKELYEARAKLAEAEAKLSAAAVVAEAPPPVVLTGLGPADAPVRKPEACEPGAPVSEAEPALPQGRWIRRQPGEHQQVGPTSAEALRIWPSSFPGRGG